jgi:CelD/BcsL family acetyltransferase involved in cellulose biosynthesis
VSDDSSVQVQVLNILDSVAASAWDDLVRSHPDATAFHQAAWGQVIHDTYGHKPLYLCFAAADAPVALVPLIEILSPITGRRAVCLPFSDACGPLLFRRGSRGVVRNQLATFARTRNWKYCEIRGGELMEDSVASEVTFYGHTLQLLPDPDAVFAQFGNGTRGAVKQAIKNGVTVEISRDAAAIKEFYRLQVQTRQKHGVPPQPFAFFDNVHKKMIVDGLGFTVLARAQGRIVAGAVFLRNAQHALYKFAASDSEFSKTRGNNLVLWEAIRYLIANGCGRLNFGRTSPDHDGLRRFKLSWGAAEEMIQYQQFDVKQGCWAAAVRRDSDGIQNSIIRKLPTSINRLAGAMLYPHLD